MLCDNEVIAPSPIHWIPLAYGTAPFAKQPPQKSRIQVYLEPFKHQFCRILNLGVPPQGAMLS